MNLSEYEKGKPLSFFRATKRTINCYTQSAFSYLAVKFGENYQLCQGRLLLHWGGTSIGSRHFQSSNVRAGVYRLEDLDLTLQQFIEILLTGPLPTPHGTLHFPSEQGRSHSIWFDLHRLAEDAQRRYIQLSIQGDRHNQPSRELDWELKAASPPFEGVAELCSEYSIGVVNSGSTEVSIAATNVAEATADSFVSGTRCCIKLALAGGLERKEASIGYRIVLSDGKVAKRAEISNEMLTWTSANGVQRGEFEMDVPAPAYPTDNCYFEDSRRGEVRIGISREVQSLCHNEGDA